MKKAYLIALAAGAMLLAGCSDADQNGNKNRTTTPSKTAAGETEIPGEVSVTETITSKTETETTTTAKTQEQERPTSTTAPDESSSQTETATTIEEKEPEKTEDDIKTENNRITSKAFGLDISYPDGWVVKSYDDNTEKLSRTIASASNDDLGVTATIELLSFDDELEEGRLVTDEELTEKLRQAYTDMTSSEGDPEDPMSVTDVNIEDGKTGKARTILLSYVQRNVKSYFYTFVFRESEETNHFLVFSYAYSESENAQHIKTALEEMMSK